MGHVWPARAPLQTVRHIAAAAGAAQNMPVQDPHGPNGNGLSKLRLAHSRHQLLQRM
jgi:hypothetical protein